MKTDKHPEILIISGFDPCGGAGLIADIETSHALGCRTRAVISCQTIQNTEDATACLPSDEAVFKQQLHSAIETHSFSAVKIGLTPSLAIIDIVASVLPRLNCPIVIDPIIAAGGGYVFCDAGTVAQLARKLIPLCDLATPNVQELKHLAEISNPSQAAASLLKRGCKAVLVSSEYQKRDSLYHRLYRLQHPPQTFAAKRLAYRYRGSGCILASATAAYLAHGNELISAIKCAQEFTYNCLLAATPIGKGIAIPQRFKQ